MRIPMGRDRVWNRVNVGRWMREHARARAGISRRQLVADAAEAFAVTDLLAGHEPGDSAMGWVWQVAGQVEHEVADALGTELRVA